MNVDTPSLKEDAISQIPALHLLMQLGYTYLPPSEALALDIAYGIALVDGGATGSRDLQDRGIHVRLTLHPLRLFD